MNPQENFAELDKNALNFVATEVSVSLTFAKLARDTRDCVKRESNLEKAMRGYQTARYFLRKAAERHEPISPHIIEGMKTVRFMLREMGQSIPE